MPPINQLPTITRIYGWYESQPRKHRPHLGASQIGHYCIRALWYQFRWCSSPTFDGRMLRLFDHGEVEETRVVRDLKRIGCEVHAVDPVTGRQISFKAFGGHFALSLDGAVQGIPESDAWHVLEVKTASAKRFAALEKDGLAKWSPQYLAQVIIGMELSGMSRTLHLTVCKDTDQIYGERVKANKEQAKLLLERAERIIFAEQQPPGISERPDWYQCKFCDHSRICHHGGTAEVNCRSCLHSTPEADGSWSCSDNGNTLSVADQRRACPRHLYRPSLVTAQAVDAGEDWIEYQAGEYRFKNCAESGQVADHAFSSHELEAMGDLTTLPLDDLAAKTRVKMQARIGAVRDDSAT